jgi:hypothetical protein
MNQEDCEKTPKRLSLSLAKKTDRSTPQLNTSSSGSEFNQQQTTQSTDDSCITTPAVELLTNLKEDRSAMDIDNEDQLNGTLGMEDSLMAFSDGNTSLAEQSSPKAALDRSQTTALDHMDEDFVDDVSGNVNPTDTLPNEVAGTPERSKMVGEDVFTEACVKTWQGSRIKAWEHRYLVRK